MIGSRASTGWDRCPRFNIGHPKRPGSTGDSSSWKSRRCSRLIFHTSSSVRCHDRLVPRTSRQLLYDPAICVSAPSDGLSGTRCHVRRGCKASSTSDFSPLPREAIASLGRPVTSVPVAGSHSIEHPGRRSEQSLIPNSPMPGGRGSSRVA